MSRQYIKVSTHFYSFPSVVQYVNHISSNTRRTYDPIIFRSPHGNGGVFFVGREATEDDIAFLPPTYLINLHKFSRIRVCLRAIQVSR